MVMWRLGRVLARPRGRRAAGRVAARGIAAALALRGGGGADGRRRRRRRLDGRQQQAGERNDHETLPELRAVYSRACEAAIWARSDSAAISRAASRSSPSASANDAPSSESPSAASTSHKVLSGTRCPSWPEAS